ncbi:MAG: flagellar hook-associated protein FlgL, partial [Rhodoferax sp.]|nr:flagellar hook-associated protein FlgL [Rhodoferax sp.]
MSVASFSRLGSANAYDNTIANLQTRQNSLSTLQEQMTSGKKITTPSDDPTGAAQAERALNRLARIATDQRALDAQKNSIAQAESTLSDVTDTLQQIRDLATSAGNAGFSISDRKTVALQISGLRERLLDLANSKDSNGQPLFAALGSALKPFAGPATTPDYSFNGLAGTSAGNTFSIPSALDGDSAFMLQPGRDAAYNVQTNAGSKLTTGGVSLVAAASVPANAKDLSYTIDGMSVSAGIASFSLTTTDNSTLPPSVVAGPVGYTAPWTAGTGFTVTQIPGVSLTISGTPTATDSLEYWERRHQAVARGKAVALRG